jgi:hypothetical protein
LRKGGQMLNSPTPDPSPLRWRGETADSPRLPIAMERGRGWGLREMELG